jgi:hypothetical protein
MTQGQQQMLMLECWEGRTYQTVQLVLQRQQQMQNRTLLLYCKRPLVVTS